MCRISRAGLMLGSTDWYGVGAGVLAPAELVAGGENSEETGVSGNGDLSLSVLGDVNEGEEEVELIELSEERFNNEEIGENADFSRVCCKS